MKKLLVAMSGGVDSAATALFLRRAGHECVGVTMTLTAGAEKDARDAKAVCDALGMEHITLDLRERFQKEVVDRFVGGYLAGLTPNPCLFCNKHLKFGALLREAENMGLDGIATGHYARVVEKPDGTCRVARAACLAKDQSYVLYSLSSDTLSKAVFPLGEVAGKEEVRAAVKEAGLPVADKGDSQDICFLPEGDYAAFLEKAVGHTFPAGDFVDRDGNVLGRHAGLPRYTVGQRKGLGIALGEPMYVAGKSAKDNTVTLVRDEDLFSDTFRVGELTDATPCGTFRADVRVRYKARAALGTVTVENGIAAVALDAPARAVTPGQAAVFYDGDEVIGGGIIL